MTPVAPVEVDETAHESPVRLVEVKVTAGASPESTGGGTKVWLVMVTIEDGQLPAVTVLVSPVISMDTTVLAWEEHRGEREGERRP